MRITGVCLKMRKKRCALIIGSGEIEEMLLSRLSFDPKYKFVTSVDRECINHLENINALIITHLIDEVYIILPSVPLEEIGLIFKLCAKTTVFKIIVVFKESPKILNRWLIKPICGMESITFNNREMSSFWRWSKRGFDIVGTLLLFILLSPLFGVLIICILLMSGWPVYFVQERIGKEGEHIFVYKFRTMCRHAPHLLKSLLHLNEAIGPIFKLKDDPRITSIGKILRRFSLDELPQLFNVLKGKMSLIGPRPHMELSSTNPSEVENHKSWYNLRLLAIPGITGLAQVYGRTDLTFDEMVLLDIYYIKNWHPWLDIKILFLTIPAIIKQ